MIPACVCVGTCKHMCSCFVSTTIYRCLSSQAWEEYALSLCGPMHVHMPNCMWVKASMCLSVRYLQVNVRVDFACVFKTGVLHASRCRQPSRRTYIHTYIPIYIHTYIHTYIHALILTCVCMVMVYIYIAQLHQNAVSWHFCTMNTQNWRTYPYFFLDNLQVSQYLRVPLTCTRQIVSINVPPQRAHISLQDAHIPRRRRLFGFVCTLFCTLFCGLFCGLFCRHCGSLCRLLSCNLHCRLLFELPRKWR